MFDFQKHRNFTKSYRMIIRIIIYGIVTIALVMLIRYQQERNEVQFQSPPTIHEIQFEDSLFLMEEPLE